MPKKKSVPKKAGEFDGEFVWNEFLKVFDVFFKFILEVFSVLFKFILELFKVVNTFVRTILGVVVLALFAALIAVLTAYLTMSALGLKDSERFQEYRDTLLNEAWEVRTEHMQARTEYVEANDDSE